MLLDENEYEPGDKEFRGADHSWHYCGYKPGSCANKITLWDLTLLLCSNGLSRQESDIVSQALAIGSTDERQLSSGVVHSRGSASTSFNYWTKKIIKREVLDNVSNRGVHESSQSHSRRSDLRRDVKKRIVIKDTGATVQNTGIVLQPTAGTPEQFTRSPEEETLEPKDGIPWWTLFVFQISKDVLMKALTSSFVPSDPALTGKYTAYFVAYKQESDETQTVKKLDALRTPESFVTHFNFDIPGGTVYYILKVSTDVLLCAIEKVFLSIKEGKEKVIEKRLKNGNAYSLCGSFDHNKRRCPKRFEDQEQVVVKLEVVVQEKKVLVQEEEDLVQEYEDLVQ
ncbi:hypothetical protein Tco_0321035 [Tanacetum coccineum]